MEEVIVVEDIVTMDCRRIIHLMSNREFDNETLACYDAPEGTQAQIGQEAGVWHLRAEWPYRGVLDFQPQGWPKFRRLVVWSLMGEERVSEAAMRAVGMFGELFRRGPGFIFVRKLPRDVDFGTNVLGMVLLEAEWMMDQAVAVGGW